jgi:curved DNA-binding protein CbpA
MADAFTVLGVDEDAGDEAIRRAYLALVRAFPPDVAPERFQAYRAAYEALVDERKRLEAKILHTNEAALSRLTMAPLRNTAPLSKRASKRSVNALLSEGILHAVRQGSKGGLF